LLQETDSDIDSLRCGLARGRAGSCVRLRPSSEEQRPAE
jgi:hypothetical protein